MIEQNIQAPKRYKILLIGDKGTDLYTYGNVERISPEAPIPIFNPVRQVSKPGMADNVRVNLEALGCEVTFKHGDVSVKERLIDERSKQQIVRIDKDVKSVPLLMTRSMFKNYDAVVISDYNKGTVSYELMEQAIKNNKFVFIDTKKADLERLQGAWVKINELEYSKIKSDCTGLIVTRGANGAEAKWHEHVALAPKVEVVDVTGAGDTFLSALAYMFLNTQNIKVAMEFANRAAAVTVQHVGCYAPELKEIK
jgi:D-beta-D-heptose 7-phosphate kinase/D-beta-D-heptose 1-phosphate adenosyltransferase